MARLKGRAFVASTSRLVLLGALIPVILVATSGVSGGSETAQGIGYNKMANLISEMNSQANELNNANQLLLQSCMRAKGFIFYPDIGTSSAGTLNGPLPEGSFLTAVQASTEGYGLYSHFVSYANQQNVPQAVTEENQYESTLSAKEQAKYVLAENGPPKDRFNFNIPGIGVFNGPKKGCAATADKESYGSVQSAELVPNAPARIYAEWENVVASDLVVKQLFSKWSSCASESGFNYSSPAVAYQKLQSAYEKKGPTQALRSKEMKVASMDVRCENMESWKSKLRIAEGNDAAGIMKSEADFILHAQEQNKKLLSKLSKASN